MGWINEVALKILFPNLDPKKPGFQPPKPVKTKKPPKNKK